MVKNFTKLIFQGLILCCFLLGSLHALGQTVTIRNVDPGPYGTGSTIAAEITTDETGGNFSLTNNYNLYLSDANGNFANQTQIGSFSGFFTGFVNGIIPNNIPAGTGYRVRVQSTAPVYTSAPSAPITINAVTGVLARAASTSTSSASEEVFGTCVGQNGNQFTLTSPLAGTHTVTATLYNDMTRQSEGSTITINTIGQRTPALSTSSYTVLVKAVNADGTVGTKAYLLINNIINIIFGAQNSGSKCLLDGEAQVTYNVDVSTPAGIQRNYPGSIYTVVWGDGTSQNFTLKQIQAVGGILAHAYRNSSCGARNAQNSITNQFQVRFSVTNPYCPPPSNADNPNTITTNQTVLLPPKNNIAGPDFICLGVEATFLNASYPGQTVTTGNAPGCLFNNASYTWSVDGVVKATGKRLTEEFKWTFTTRGPHSVTVELENPQSDCPPEPFTKPVCVQEPPRPAFDIDAARCTNDGPVLAVDRSVLDLGCNDNYTYAWTVSPAAGVTFANNTNAASRSPQFVFANPGTYDIYLEITNSSCGTFRSPVKQIVITSIPVATLSADFSLCGRGQTLTFDNTTGSPTQTVLTGTVTPQANTYQWTVVGQGGIAPAIFANGTTANSQYPQITFPAFGTYDVTVIHTNNCGTKTSNTQHITFREAPTVLAGPDQIICPGTTAQLDGQVIGTFNSRQWSTSGTGTFSDRNAEKPIYTPSAADRTAGTVTLTLSITTSLPGDCANISDQLVLTINPANTLTSASTKTICTGSSVAYTPASTVAGSTFNWVVLTQSANASGYSPTGTGDITDVLTNSSASANATVTYRITPRANNCDGTPFDLTVTVAPKPQITLTGPANNTVCSGSPAGIQIDSNVPGTQYTWTIAVNGGVSGAAEQTTPVATTGISQVLTNVTSTPATVTYTFTPINANSADLCTGTPQPITITVQPQVPAANAGTDAILCNQPTFQLQGNDPGAGFTGTWTVVSGQTGVTFTNANQFNTTVNGLQGGQVYTFRWTINGASSCAPQFDEVKVTDYLPITNFEIIAPVSTLTCSGNTIQITGRAAQGGNNTPLYQWQTSTDNGATWNTLSNETGRDIETLVVGNIWFRRITTAGVCDATSNVVQITVQPPITNNTIGAAQPQVCYNTSTTISGIGTISGADGNASNYTYRWQQRSNPTAAWQIIAGATGANYTTANLTVTTQYRRLVGSSLCEVSPSNVVEVTVVQNSIAKIIFNTDADCAPFDLMANNNIRAEEHADRNQRYEWYVNDELVGTGINFPMSYKLNDPGQSVTVKLVTISFNNCQPNATDSHIFKTSDRFTLDFKASLPIVNNTITVCGTTKITFTNLSTPITSATYSWNFGGAPPATSLSAQPGEITFTANPPGGDDKTYTVTLNGTPNCGVAIPKTITVIVTPDKPLPIVDAATKFGCGSLTTSVTNITNGTNASYIIYVKNVATNQEVYRSGVLTNKDPQSVFVNTVGNFDIFLEATSLCGIKATSLPVRVQVVPSNLTALLQPAPGQLTEGCSPLSVTFNNNSSNITSYWYEWGDGSRSEVFNNTGSTIPPITHIYTAAGTFFPKLHVANSCTPDKVSTDLITIIVHDRPAPAFRFVIAESQTCYTCSVVTFTNTTPDPNGNIVYTWDFGDGSAVSHDVNPQHEYDYSKGSKYLVKLTARNIYTCDAVATREVTILEPNTQLFLPNAFTPNSNNPELKTFIAKGSGLKQWHMRVFNNYGQLVWETTKLDSRGEPVDGWDGTFQGSQMPQGVYIWQIEASFINGSEWKGMSYNGSSPKRTGVIHLIR
jgi:gliding motility-associated-like protein